MQTLFLTTLVVGTILLLFQLFFILLSFNSEKLQDFILSLTLFRLTSMTVAFTGHSLREATLLLILKELGLLLNL